MTDQKQFPGAGKPELHTPAQLAQAIAMLLLGVALIALGGTNLFINLFEWSLIGKDEWFSGLRSWKLVTVILTVVFAGLPFAVGVWLVMRAGMPKVAQPKKRGTADGGVKEAKR